MTTFSFNTLIPASNNNPSADQPEMQINNLSTNNLLAVDHVSFNSTGPAGPDGSGGQHLQVTFNGKNGGTKPKEPISILSTSAGTASIVAQLFFFNANVNIPISYTPAFGVYAGSSVNGVVAPVSQANITSVTRTAKGGYDVILATNAVQLQTFGVQVSASFRGLLGEAAIIANYTITGTGLFSLSFTDVNSVAADPIQFTFQVLQL